MSTLPDPKRLESMRAAFAKPLEPVSPLPSNALMASIVLTSFIIFCILISSPLGFNGFHAFTIFQKLVYYGVVLVFGALFSVASVEHIIPGAKRHFNIWTLTLGSLLAITLLSLFLFPDYSLDGFVKNGFPCLQLALISAMFSGILGFWASRKGLLTSPLPSAVLMASFAGLTGVGVLALHCPVQNWVHILAWHLGAIPIAGLAGWLLGMRVSGD